MSVRRDRRNRRWFFRTIVHYPDGSRRRISGTPGAPGPYQDLSQTKVGALEAERRGIAAALAGSDAAPPRDVTPEPTPGTEKAKEETNQTPTVNDYAPIFVERFAAQHKPSEQRSKRQVLRGHLLPHFGDLRLDEIRQVDVDGFVAAELDRGMARKTIDNRLAVLSSLLRYAWKNGVIAKPTLQLNIGSKPGRIEAVRPEDIDAILAHAGPIQRAAILMMAEAGLRAGEARGLQWTDISDGQLVIRRALDRVGCRVISPKHDRVRVVPLSDALKDALPHLGRRGVWVLCTADGAPLSPGRGLRAPIARLYDLAGVPRPAKVLHALRHSYGTALAADGVPLPVIKELMGHSSVTTTMRYIDVSERQKREAISKTFGRRTGRRGSSVAARRS